MKTKILVGLLGALLAAGVPGAPFICAAESELVTAKEFSWGDQTALKVHLEKHVTYPTTGKAIKEACKKEMPGEFTKEQGAYLDAKLKDDATFNNPAEVLAALDLK